MRIVRVLVYEGSPEWLRETFAHNALKDERSEFFNSDHSITDLTYNQIRIQMEQPQ